MKLVLLSHVPQPPKMKKAIIILLCSLPLQVVGQKGMVKVFTEFGVPTGDFRQNTDAIALGMGMGAYFSFDAQNLFYLGADLSYDIYGKSFDSDGYYEIITNNNMLQFHGLLRIKPPSDGIVPFFEGLYGFKFLYTISKLKENILLDPIAIQTDFYDFALSYGGAAGIHIPLGQGNTALEFRVQYLIGGKAEYVDGKTIREVGIENAIANPLTSETDMVIFKLGLTFGW